MDIAQQLHSIERQVESLPADAAVEAASASGGRALAGLRAALQLMRLYGAALAETDDPRIAAGFASYAQELAHQTQRLGIASASAVELTAAHSLDAQEYDQLREGTADFSAAPRYAAGRTLYQCAAEFLSRWLNLPYYEAARRVADAHLVRRRPSISGTPAPARFQRLAACFDPAEPICGASADAPPAQPDALPDHYAAPDPGSVLRTARALNAFEDPDRTDEGLADQLTARGADGRLLEEAAAQLLRERDRCTRDRQVNKLIRDYKDAHVEKSAPPLGLHRGKRVAGVQSYVINVAGAEIEVIESLIAKADNKRTAAGAAARTAAGIQTPPDAQPPRDEESTDPDSPPEPQAESKDAQHGAPDASQAPPSDQGPESSHEPPPADEGRAAQPPEEHPAPDDGHLSSPPQGGTPSADPPQRDPLFSSGDPIPDWAADGPPGGAEPGSAPRSTEPEQPAPMPQEPTVAQRRLNALMSVLLTTDPQSGGQRIIPEIIVHARLEDLRDLDTVSGITAHGQKLDAAHLRAMLCEAKILSPIYNGDGVVLDMNRQLRLFPRSMKLAARDRDGGCIVPGCTRDPALLDFHHIQSWESGGRTSLENCCPLCEAHHVSVHLGVIKIVTRRGLPYAVLPKHLDPQQLPRRNEFFRRT